RADVWIIGMHPGILSHMPVPRPDCRLVLTGPGVTVSTKADMVSAMDETGELVICYAGPVTEARGMSVIADWAGSYQGPPAILHLMGQADEAGARLIDGVVERAAQRGLRVVRHGWVVHSTVIEILGSGHIGICLIDPDVLNYRYAYPIKVGEYMSQGVIPVATDGQGVRSLIRHGENGFVARFDNVAFAAIMTEAVTAVADAAKRKTIVANAVQTVAGRHWNEVNERLIADLKTALLVEP
ncbi:glycosyltransferase, partial [Thioclava indica]